MGTLELGSSYICINFNIVFMFSYEQFLTLLGEGGREFCLQRKDGLTSQEKVMGKKSTTNKKWMIKS